MPIFRDSGGPRKISIRGWRILGHGETRGYNWKCPILMEDVDKGRRAVNLDKWYRLIESRDNKPTREVEELRPKL